MKTMRLKFTQSVLVACNDWEGLIKHLIAEEWHMYFCQLDADDEVGIEMAIETITQLIGMEMIHTENSYRAVPNEVIRFVEGFGNFFLVKDDSTCTYITYTHFLADKFWLVAQLEQDEDEVEEQVGRW